MKRRYFKRSWRLTREGKTFVLITMGVGLAAVNTGNNLLYLILGLMLSLILLSGILSELVLRRLRVQRRLPERVFAQTTSLVEIVLGNDKRFLPSFSLEVEDFATGEPNERRCYFLKVAAHTEQVAAYRRTPTRRGVLKLTGFRVGTRYPFGLIEKSYVCDSVSELTVFPRLFQGEHAQLLSGLTEGEVPAGRVGAGGEVAGIRDYRLGDEARAIHWRRTASLSRVVVREREKQFASRVTLLLDNARPSDADAAWDESFEVAVSRAASIAAHASSQGAAVEVFVRGGGSSLVPPGSPPDPVWRFLALVQPIPAENAPRMPVPSADARVLSVDSGASRRVSA